MTDSNKQLDTLLTALEEKKKNIMAAALVAKQEFLDALENVEEKIEDIDTDSLKMRLTLAKLKVLEEWDDIEEKIENLGGKTLEIAKSSEDEVKEGWEKAKQVAGDIEQRISNFFSRNV